MGRWKRLKKKYRGRRKGAAFLSSEKPSGERNSLKERLLWEYLQSCNRAKPCKVLFVCTANMERSPAAERLVKNISRLKVKSAGLNARDWGPRSGVRSKQLTYDLVDWSDMIFVMDNSHKRAITRQIPSARKKIVVLNIPDIYGDTYDPRLKSLLRQKLSKYFPELRK